MEIKIEDCENLEEYLALCHAKSVDDLKRAQVLAWARSGKMGLDTQLSVDIVEHGLFEKKPDKKKAVQLLKQAMVEKKEFYCMYVENESCNGPMEEGENEHEYFKMYIR